MLVKRRLKNHYFKFWHLQFKNFEKEKLHKSVWFNQLIKKNTLHGKSFKVAKFWYQLSKFLNKQRLEALPLILKSLNNLDIYLNLVKKRQRNYQILYPNVLTYTQRFFIKLKLFYNSLKYRKDESYFKKLFMLILQNFSKKVNLRTKFYFKYIWNKKRFFGKNKKHQRSSYKKFKYKKTFNNAYTTKNL